MAIGPLNATATVATTLPVQPVAEAGAVRQLVGRLVALAQTTLGAQNPQPALSPEARLIQAVAAAVQAAAPRQGGLGPLMADLRQAVAALPPSVQAAAVRVLAMQTPLGPAVTGAEVKAAFSQSGLFLEARMAAAAQAAAAGQAAPAPPIDLKAALLIARGVLARWTETAAEPEAAAPPTPAQAAAQQASARPAGPPPPPPLRQAPPSAQPQAQPSLAPDAAAPRAARRLLQETDAALARQELFQAASLPEALQTGARRSEVASPHWLFEVPFTSAQGQGVAQFEIEGDGDAGRPGATRAWRARFSLDIEPLGPLHAQLALVGRRAGVSLWAERPESAAQLKAWQGLLAEALEAADYFPEVAVIAGAPPRAPAPAGAFVDRTS